MGWLLIKKHKDVKLKGASVDMSDLEADPVVRFQQKYYMILMPLIAFIFPILLPWYCWNEKFYVAYYICLFRYSISLNITWLVNSVAHMFGSKPYDRYIKPSENRLIAFLAFGEGFHNYHHVFPWDYKTDELGFNVLNCTTMVINFFAKIGWAYNLKTASPEIIRQRQKRTGATSVYDEQKCDEKEFIWGWDDKALTKEVKQAVEVHNYVHDD